MADSKITALTALTAADPINDMLPIVDVSDTTMAASGTTKKISVNNILSSSPTASGALTVTGLVTAGSATITGALTSGTTTLVSHAAGYTGKVGIGTATPADTLDVNGRVTALRYLSSSSNASLPSYAVAAGNGIYNSGTNEIGFSINSANAMTLNTSGNLAFPDAKGIDFSAKTPDGSGTVGSEVLNDYEEGTFTPTFTAAIGTGFTVTLTSATYTKIGRRVFLEVDFTITVAGSASSALYFTLPFSQASSPSSCGAFRESNSTGYMGQLFHVDGTRTGASFYNDSTVWVNNYRLRGSYSYNV